MGNNEVMHQNVNCGRGGARGGSASGGSAHRLVHKIVKNGQALKRHHVKSSSLTGFILHTHCNDGHT